MLRNVDVSLDLVLFQEKPVEHDLIDCRRLLFWEGFLKLGYTRLGPQSVGKREKGTFDCRLVSN